MFGDAMRLVVREHQASVSFLQRRLKVGYSRAARLMDLFEAAGVVSPYDGSKAREVMVDESFLEDGMRGVRTEGRPAFRRLGGRSSSAALLLLTMGSRPAGAADPRAEGLLAQMRPDLEGSYAASRPASSRRQEFAGFDEPLLSRGRLQTPPAVLLRSHVRSAESAAPGLRRDVRLDLHRRAEAGLQEPPSTRNRRGARISSTGRPEGARSLGAVVRHDVRPRSGPARSAARPRTSRSGTLRVWVRGSGRELLGYEATDTEGNRTRMRLVELQPAKGLKPEQISDSSRLRGSR